MAALHTLRMQPWLDDAGGPWIQNNACANSPGEVGAHALERRRARHARRFPPSPSSSSSRSSASTSPSGTGNQSSGSVMLIELPVSLQKLSRDTAAQRKHAQHRPLTSDLTARRRRPETSNGQRVEYSRARQRLRTKTRGPQREANEVNINATRLPAEKVRRRRGQAPGGVAPTHGVFPHTVASRLPCSNASLTRARPGTASGERGTTQLSLARSVTTNRPSSASNVLLRFPPSEQNDNQTNESWDRRTTINRTVPKKRGIKVAVTKENSAELTVRFSHDRTTWNSIREGAVEASVATPGCKAGFTSISGSDSNLGVGLTQNTQQLVQSSLGFNSFSRSSLELLGPQRPTARPAASLFLPSEIRAEVGKLRGSSSYR